METLSRTTQDFLRRRKVTPTMSEDGDDIRIAGKTRSGAEFAFVLTRLACPEGEHTRVHLEWREGADSKSKATIAQVLVDLEQRYPLGTQSAKK